MAGNLPSCRETLSRRESPPPRPSRRQFARHRARPESFAHWPQSRGCRDEDVSQGQFQKADRCYRVL